MLRPVARLPVEVAPVLQRRVRRDAEVGVAADELRHPLRDRVHDLSRGRARGFLLARLQDRQIRVPAGGQARPRRAAATPRRAPGTPSRMRRSASPTPLRARFRAPTAVRKCARASGGTKKGSFHSQPRAFLVSDDLFLAERAAVRLGRAGLVRRAVPDRRVHDDDRGPALSRAPPPDRAVDRVQIRVAVLDVQDLPAVGLVAAADVLGERHGGGTVERDLVGVVEERQLAQAQVAGERRGLAGDSLHQIAVGDDGEGPVVRRSRGRAG